MEIPSRRQYPIFDYSVYNFAANIPLEGERRYFDNILTGITHPCSVLGDGVSQADALPFLEIINIESNVNISLEILRINRNKVLIKNTAGGVIVVNLGTAGVPVNYNISAGNIMLFKFNGTDWESFPIQFENIEISNNLNVTGDLDVGGIITGEILNFDSGWLLNEMAGAGVADWTNVHLGTDPTDPTDNLAHNLGAPLSELLIKVLFSTDGTDNNSFEIQLNAMDNAAAAGRCYGISVYQIDNNNIKIQTGVDGIVNVADDGTREFITTQNWYYKIKVWVLG